MAYTKVPATVTNVPSATNRPTITNIPASITNVPAAAGGGGGDHLLDTGGIDILTLSAGNQLTNG